MGKGKGKGKGKHKISNWKQYNQALVNSGLVTFWIDVVAIKVWPCIKHHDPRSRECIFSDTAIETALMVKGIFKLSLHGLEGFLNLVFTLMTVSLKSPTYTCIRNAFEDRKN